MVDRWINCGWTCPRLSFILKWLLVHLSHPLDVLWSICTISSIYKFNILIMMTISPMCTDCFLPQLAPLPAVIVHPQMAPCSPLCTLSMFYGAYVQYQVQYSNHDNVRCGMPLRSEEAVERPHTPISDPSHEYLICICHRLDLSSSPCRRACDS